MTLRSRWRDEVATDTDAIELVSAFGVQFLSALGDASGALRAIEAGPRSPRSDYPLVYLPWDALFASDLAAVHRDPHFPELLAKWGLFNYWQTTNHWPDFCDEPGLPFDCKAEARKFARAPTGGTRCSARC